mmetsp:Transcript_84290/g.132772  ORF Transcript_84290/g.132772 Transcript_84290/m.132772 type:complete len:575 (+) Transcript_84290:425-2149(+)
MLGALVGGLLGLIIGSESTQNVSFSCDLGTQPPPHGSDCSSEAMASRKCLVISDFCAAIKQIDETGPQVAAAALHEKKRVVCNAVVVDDFVTCGPEGTFSPTPQCTSSSVSTATTITGTGEAASTTMTTTSIMPTGTTTVTTTSTTNTATTTTTVTTTTTRTTSTTTTTTATTTSTMEMSVAEMREAKNKAKAEFMTIDARTETFLKLKDKLERGASEFPLSETLVAFDFDLTLRGDHPDGGIVLRLGDTTLEFLQWLKDNGVPAIVVTARKTTPQTWERTYNQADEHLQIAGLLGQHVPGRSALTDPQKEAYDASIKKPCKEEDSHCNVFAYSINGHSSIYVEGSGVLIAGYNKGEAIMHFIELHGMDYIHQVVFADDYATHATNVASVCGADAKIQRIVGVWLAPFDRESDTQEFMDSIRQKTRKLKECLEREKFSVCKPEFYKSSWCDSTVPGFVGDNSFNPLTPENLYNVEVLRLGHFPTGEDESAGPTEALEDARQQYQEIQDMQRLCREKKDLEDQEVKKAKAAAELQRAKERGGLPACASSMKCTMAKMASKPKCDITLPPCTEMGW